MAMWRDPRIGFHGYPVMEHVYGDLIKDRFQPGEWQAKFTYTFHNHFHPFVGELLERLNKRSIPGLLDSDFHEELERAFFEATYDPNESDRTVAVESFPKQIDVSEHGAYSVYNWELLFHIPLTVAVQLSKNQRFADAQRWFHYIFDPTARDGKFWRFLAFRQRDVKQIDQLLRLVSLPDDELSDGERAEKQRVLSGYDTLRRKPFQPHAVARTRFLAYQYCVVMKYLDNLIAWGDSLFRQDTVETLNEATQVYVLAANLLGPKPQRIPPRGRIKPKTFAQLRGELDRLGNALVEMEGQFPFNLGLPETDVDTEQTGPLFGIGRTLYFCVPRNEKLLGYWDTVADRLFKIRHCMNIEGMVRPLPLFDPPLDPGMLVKAAAAGIDISSLVSGLNQPPAPVRSPLLIQKASELCNEVRGLGNALLQALEKGEAEKLGRLRQEHEINIHQMAQDVRFLQWKEAEATTDALVQSRESALERYRYYQRLLGRDDAVAGDSFTLERRALTEENFDELYAQLVEAHAPDMGREAYPDIDVEEEGRLYLIDNEAVDLNWHRPFARGLRLGAAGSDALFGTLAMLPLFKLELEYWGVGGETELAGGPIFAGAGSIISSGLRTWAEVEESEGASAATKAAYERRSDDWLLQSNLAAHELALIGRQIVTSLLREQIARHEYESLKKQIEQAREIDVFLRDKFTNEELYSWIQGELSKLYYEYYKFAFDTARQAEQTVKHELMRPELDQMSFVKFNYWDGGRKGLLSGEALHLDLKRLEMAYYDYNRREYELTKHVSLRQLDPLALLSLKATGTCQVTLPEWLFDLDGPGHYMRRLKHVSLSIPAVAGPYTSVNCTLSLQRSSVRRSPLLRDGEYARALDEDDDRFVDYYGTIQSIVTSHGQDDGGLFETNLRDERFLPFEGAGAVSTWKLELPAEFRQFDYNTISDVILHVRYTARQGGEGLKQAAIRNLREQMQEAGTSGLVRLFSLRHEFPTEWHHFVSGVGETPGEFRATVKKSYFPYFVQGDDLTMTRLELYAIEGDELVSAVPDSVNLNDLNRALKDHGEFVLSLPEDGTVLRRVKGANVFLVVRYTL